MNEVNKVFTAAFESCKKELPFQREWSNGTGYFDFAVTGDHAPKLGYGEIVKSTSPGGRRVLMIGTRLGNVVVFDRFAEQAPGQKGAHKAVFVRNTTKAIEHGGWFAEPALDDYEVTLVFGEEGYPRNLSDTIEELWKALQEASKLKAVAA